MKHLKDLPEGTVWPHLLEAIERDVIADIRSYAQSRKRDVDRGAESPALAATLVEKYGEGLAKALAIVGVDSQVQRETDRLVREIDANFEANKAARWEARPAMLFPTEPKHEGGEKIESRQ